MSSGSVMEQGGESGINRTGFIKGRQKKALLFVLMLLIASIFIPGPGEGGAFHSGAVMTECPECHTGNGDGFTLRGVDLGSTCLRCHQATDVVDNPTWYYVATPDAKLTKGKPPVQLTPGGDFAYLKKDYSWSLPGGETGTSFGYKHGHNVVAQSYGYFSDSTKITAPGGEYPANYLTCTSCHNPHAIISQVTVTSFTGSYRLLGGTGYAPKMIPGVNAFKADTPVAVSPSQYNRTEALTDTRIAYGKGMSEWCMNCHPNVGGHRAGNTVRFPQQIINNYNSYIKTGDASGNSKSSYTSLVPFEEGIGDAYTLSSHADITGQYKNGPDANSNVMCLTCHRAHASAFDHIMRWDTESQYIVYSGIYPGMDNGSQEARGRTASELQQAYYGRPSSSFANGQKSLCGKCHASD